jgi:hypothetical protein
MRHFLSIVIPSEARDLQFAAELQIPRFVRDHKIGQIETLSVDPHFHHRLMTLGGGNSDAGYFSKARSGAPPVVLPQRFKKPALYFPP